MVIASHFRAEQDVKGNTKALFCSLFFSSAYFRWMKTMPVWWECSTHALFSLPVMFTSQACLMASGLTGLIASDMVLHLAVSWDDCTVKKG